MMQELIATRKRLAISQKELGRRIGLSQSRVAVIESGRHDVTLKTVQRYAEALGCGARLVLEDCDYAAAELLPED